MEAYRNGSAPTWPKIGEFRPNLATLKLLAGYLT